VPKELRSQLVEPSLRAGKTRYALVDGVDLSIVRAAIRDRRKLEIEYADTTRVVWPFQIGFLDEVRMVVAHCELRGDLRHFRADRLRAARLLDARIPESQRSLRKRWEQQNPQRV